MRELVAYFLEQGEMERLAPEPPPSKWPNEEYWRQYWPGKWLIEQAREV